MTANTLVTQSAFAQNTGGTPAYRRPRSNTSSGNSTSGNTTK